MRRCAIALLLAWRWAGRPTTDRNRLTTRMNRFGDAYNRFAAGVNGGVFDARAAARLSGLWKQVEASASGPKGIKPCSCC